MDGTSESAGVLAGHHSAPWSGLQASLPVGPGAMGETGPVHLHPAVVFRAAARGPSERSASVGFGSGRSLFDLVLWM